MKRALFALAAILTATAAVFVVTLVTILPTAQQVTFLSNPQFAFGDPADVQGLKLIVETQMDGQLHWTTTFTPAESPSSRTQFRFSPKKEPIPYQNPDFAPQLSLVSSFSPTASEGDVFDVIPHTYNIYKKMVEDVASRAPAQGGNYSETVKLRDYLKYYPISVVCDDWDVPGYPYYEAVDLSNVFSIPIDAEETAEISVTVQPDGTISSFSFYAPDMPYISAEIVYAHEAFYVPFPYDILESGLDHTDITPGLYRLPLKITDDDTTVVDVDGIELVASMDSPAQKIALTGNGKQLALITSANEKHPIQLTLFDLSSGAQLQQFDLDDTDQGQVFYAGDDYMVFMGSTQEDASIQWRMEAWRLDEDGSFSSFISTSNLGNIPFYGSSISCMLQNDTIYMASYPSSNTPNYIVLSVFDPQGCKYVADLTLSQCQDSSVTRHPITMTELRMELDPTA